MNCGLCPMQLRGECSGCFNGSTCYQGCPIAPCSVRHGNVDSEFLYDLCVSASVYRDLRRITTHPMTIPEITNALRANHNVTQQDVVNIIGVAALASKNKSALIKARYHMFAKALEGAYITLGQNKRLMLNRNRSITIDGDDWKVYECAICDDCGRVAVAGREINGKLEQYTESLTLLGITGWKCVDTCAQWIRWDNFLSRASILCVA